MLKPAQASNQKTDRITNIRILNLQRWKDRPLGKTSPRVKQFKKNILSFKKHTRGDIVESPFELASIINETSISNVPQTHKNEISKN